MLEIPNDVDPVQAFSVGQMLGGMAAQERERDLSGRDAVEIERDHALRALSEARAHAERIAADRRRIEAFPDSADSRAARARFEAAELDAKLKLTAAQQRFQTAQAAAAELEAERRLSAERRIEAEQARRAARIAELSSAAMQASTDADAAVAALGDAVERRMAAMDALVADGVVSAPRTDWKGRASTKNGVAMSHVLAVALEVPLRGLRPDTFVAQARAAGVKVR